MRRAHQAVAKQSILWHNVTVGSGCPPYNIYTQ